MDETTSIEAYTDRTSVAPGETIGFHVASSTPGERYRIELYRLGWYGGAGARRIACLPCDNEHVAPAAPPAFSNPATGELRAQWPLGQSVTVEADWTSGYASTAAGSARPPARSSRGSARPGRIASR